ncbi:TPA: ATP-binding protein [Klebsiella oxytoca]|uniref:ATP-binding protein n=1 Tax=Klebsiella oxytoca TaxID=571 RepID=UPI0030146485
MRAPRSLIPRGGLVIRALIAGDRPLRAAGAQLHLNAGQEPQPERRVDAATQVNNALRYTQAKGEVVIILQHQRLRVVDNGPGEMPHHQERPGERFFRPAGASENGSGLGGHRQTDCAPA